VRTLKARAFDVARYLLPLATNTSLGQIVNARTLETQICRLLSSEFAEVRGLGEKLRTAAADPAWNVTHDEARVLVEEACSTSPEMRASISGALLREVKAAPTLVKYAAPSQYAIQTRSELRAAAAELMAGQPIDAAPVVDLVEPSASLEVELATSLLYPECHYSWRQLERSLAALSGPRIAAIIHLGTKHRGRHDELPRPFSAGQSVQFDILMDIGGFRDMHRHRRCVQLLQPYTVAHGYETPACPGQPTLAEAGLDDLFSQAMDAAFAAYRGLRDAAGPEAAAYLLPLGTRVRAMFKMDFAEALYIAELRSGIAGHFSYRRIAWEMYLAVAKRHPGLASCFRIEDVNQPVDLLKR
jgi:thymidylate synthase ThyX